MRGTKSGSGKTKYFTPRMKSWEKIKQLKSFGIDFTVSYTQRTCKIRAGKEVYLFGTSNDYTISEFHMQQRLKKHILDLHESGAFETPKYTEKDISYSCYSPSIMEMPLDEELKTVLEFDVNKAYYQCAYNLGYISREMYESYIGLKKHIRLRFIGTIATRKRVYSYVKGKLKNEVKLVDNPVLRGVWFHICLWVDKALQRFMELAGDRFLMYYVDGIYVIDKGDGFNWDKVLAEIKKEFNFDFKNCLVDGLFLRQENKNLQVVIRKYDEDKNQFKEKPFTLKKQRDWQDDAFGKLIEENKF